MNSHVPKNKCAIVDYFTHPDISKMLHDEVTNNEVINFLQWLINIVRISEFYGLTLSKTIELISINRLIGTGFANELEFIDIMKDYLSNESSNIPLTTFAINHLNRNKNKSNKK